LKKFIKTSGVIFDSEFKNSLFGIHVEGPFISKPPCVVGAHNPEFAKEPSILPA
jgi:N-acetylglucosamine-6-phosphate deacetylase